MNLIETFANELKDKHFNELEKTRYIYRRICEELSFHEEFFYLKGSELEEYLSKRIDVRNLDTREYVCHQYTKDILPQVLNEFTSVKIEPHIGERHSYTLATIGYSRWILDPTRGDTTRAKLNLSLNGMHLQYSDHNFESMDKELGFTTVRKDSYTKNIVGNVADKMNTIANIINSTKCKQSFSDATVAHYLLADIVCPFSSRDTYKEGELIREIIPISLNENEYIYEIKREGQIYILKKK